MREKGIVLSPKHGVNPSLGVCFYCGKEDGTVMLPGRLKGDAEAPRRAVWTQEPCAECKGYMAQGVIFISVRDGEAGDNPFRTGAWAVVREEAVRRIITTPEVLADVLRRRVAFVPDAAWELIGLPRGEVKGGAA